MHTASEMSDDLANYTQDGPVAKRIAEHIPYYKYKGIDRFCALRGHAARAPRPPAAHRHRDAPTPSARAAQTTSTAS